MEPAAAVTILGVVLVVAALVVYLVATIQQLRIINAGLDIVLGAVDEIVAKSSPVNGVVDGINKTLELGRGLLEGLLVKKAGAEDGAGLVESLFPGQGQNWLRLVGKSGKPTRQGTVYTRGTQTLAALGRGAPIGAAHVKGPAIRDAKYQTTEVAKMYPRGTGGFMAKGFADPKARPKSPVVGGNAPRQYEAALTPGTRARMLDGGPGGIPFGTAPTNEPKGPTGRPSAPAGPAPSASGDAPPSSPGKISVVSKRPWE